MKRKVLTSYTNIKYQRYRKCKEKAIKTALEFFKDREIKVICSLMAGVGITAQLCLTQIENCTYTMIDINKDCIEKLKEIKQRFPFAKIKIFHMDAYEYVLERKTDIVWFDHNNFTLNKIQEFNKLYDWITSNKNYFRYFVLVDSFHFSLKFLDTVHKRANKWDEYVTRIKKAFPMTLKTITIYDNKDCCIFIFESNKEVPK